MDKDLSEEEKREAEAFLERGGRRAAILGALEKRLGLPVGFVVGLSGEPNDWAFIVKLAVAVEAAVTQALVLHIGNELMYDHFSSITNGRRLELARTLGILEPADKDTLGVLATVRNSFAHEVKNLTGSLASYIDSLNPDKKVDFLSKLIQLEGTEKPKATDNFNWLPKGFRNILHAAVVPPLISLAAHGTETQRKRERQEWLEANSRETTRFGLASMFGATGGPTLLTANPKELQQMLSVKPEHAAKPAEGKA